MRLLLSGAAGYTGSLLGGELLETHWMRGLDIKPCDDEDKYPDFVVGDLTDLDTCRNAVEGVDAVVFCHMAPNPHGYKTPVPGVDINVKGTANLYHAMTEHGISRAVMVSTSGVFPRDRLGIDLPVGDGPYNFGTGGFYVLTKVMGELIARMFFEQHDIVTTLLRPPWIADAESLVTKYGERMQDYNPGLIDPRDIGVAVDKALQLPDPGLEAFVVAQDDAPYNMAPTHERLKWRPRYRFEQLRRG